MLEIRAGGAVLIEIIEPSPPPPPPPRSPTVVPPAVPPSTPVPTGDVVLPSPDPCAAILQFAASLSFDEPASELTTLPDVGAQADRATTRYVELLEEQFGERRFFSLSSDDVLL